MFLRRVLPFLLVALACGCATERAPAIPKSSPEAWVNPQAAPAGRELGTRREPYRSLDAALRQSSPRAKIFLSPGTYAVNLEVDKHLVLTSDPNAPAVLRAANPKKAVVWIKPGATAVLVGLQVVGASSGILAGPGARIAIKDCQISDNARAGIELLGKPGFWRRNAAAANIEGCLLTGNGWGVFVQDATARLTKCQVSSNRHSGVGANGAVRLNVMACRVNDNGGAGIYLSRSSRKAQVDIDQNDIKANAADGIRVFPIASSWWPWGSIQVVVRQNAISDNRGYGLAARDDDKPLPEPTDAIKLEDNQFAGNGLGATAGVNEN